MVKENLFSFLRKVSFFVDYYDLWSLKNLGANLVGQSIIGYLEKKGYPEIALHFVKVKKIEKFIFNLHSEF